MGDSLLDWRNWRDRLLRSPEEAEQLRRQCDLQTPYTDRKLIRSRMRYTKFIKDLMQCGMIKLGPYQEATVGVFFVAKK